MPSVTCDCPGGPVRSTEFTLSLPNGPTAVQSLASHVGGERPPEPVLSAIEVVSRFTAWGSNERSSKHRFMLT